MNHALSFDRARIRRRFAMFAALSGASFAALLATTMAAAAQPFGTDLLVARSDRALVRYRPAAGATTVARTRDALTRLIMDVDNRHVVGTDVVNNVLRIDPLTGAVVATIWPGAPLRFVLSALAIDRNGDYLVADSDAITKPEHSTVYRIDRQASTITSLIVFPGGYITGLRFDPSTGDLLMADSPPNAFPSILHVDPVTFAVKARVAVVAQRIMDLAADPHRPVVYLIGGPTDGVLRYDPTTRRVVGTVSSGTTFTAGTIDRAPDAAGRILHTGTATGEVHSFDRAGTNVIASAATGARVNGVAFDLGRNLVTLPAAAARDLHVRVSFPRDAGRAFALAAGLSGFAPGVRLADGRVVPLNVDALVQATLRGALAPILTGNIGVLDASGSATARLSASRLGAIPSVPLWFAAVTLDPQAPSGVRQISAPLRVTL